RAVTPPGIVGPRAGDVACPTLTPCTVVGSNNAVTFDPASPSGHSPVPIAIGAQGQAVLLAVDFQPESRDVPGSSPRLAIRPGLSAPRQRTHASARYRTGSLMDGPHTDPPRLTRKDLMIATPPSRRCTEPCTVASWP